jgi:hypothetical protein
MRDTDEGELLTMVFGPYDHPATKTHFCGWTRKFKIDLDLRPISPFLTGTYRTVYGQNLPTASSFHTRTSSISCFACSSAPRRSSKPCCWPKASIPRSSSNVWDTRRYPARRPRVSAQPTSALVRFAYDARCTNMPEKYWR